MTRFNGRENASSVYSVWGRSRGRFTRVLKARSKKLQMKNTGAMIILD